MNLYLVSGGGGGYDTYDSVVVAAKSAKDARTIHPSSTPIYYIADTHRRFTFLKNGKWLSKWGSGEVTEELYDNGWVSPKKINTLNVEFLGKTKQPRGVILASFNAG